MKSFLILLICFSVSLSFAEVISGKVISISDGDTIRLLTADKKEIKIRLNKIDAPEKNQDFGEKSKQSLSEMIFNKIVHVQYDKVDKYNRVLGVVYLDSVDVNLEQIRRGMAWVYRRYTTDKNYIEAEENARRTKKGLWIDVAPVMPENFRHKSKEQVLEHKRLDHGVFICGKKKYCSEMYSCVEAKYYFSECGISALDRDRDGVPCESLCN